MAHLRKILFSAIFTGVILLGVGCTPSGRSADPDVKTRGSLEPSALAQKDERVLPAKDASLTASERQIQVWGKNLKKSHEIFREVWAQIWEDRVQKPMSVFLEIERLLQAHKDPEDGHFRTRVHECPNRASEVALEKRGSEVVGAVFYRWDCRRGSKGKPIGERQEMARVRRLSGAEEWTFYAENMSRGAGASLALLRERIRCKMSLDSKERLASLDCENLGQNRDTETHLVFSQFQYRRNGSTLVLVEGKKYHLLTTAICDNPKFCTRVKVPLNGRIEIFEDHVSEWARDERKQANERKERQEELKEVRRQHAEALKAMRARMESVKSAQMAGGTHAPPVSTSEVESKAGLDSQGPQVEASARIQDNQPRAVIPGEPFDPGPDFGQRPVVEAENSSDSKGQGLQVMEFDHSQPAMDGATSESDQRMGYFPGEGTDRPLRESRGEAQR